MPSWYVSQACQVSFAHPVAGPNLASWGQYLEMDPDKIQPKKSHDSKHN